MKKIVTLSLGTAAAVLYLTALLSAPAPAASCANVCTGAICPGGKVQARNTCTGATGCFSFCLQP